MTGNSDTNATGNTMSRKRTRFPTLGLIALISGAIPPAWMMWASISWEPEAAAWLPVIALFLFPLNFVFIALLIIAVLCGIFAVRVPGASRVLGVIALILGAVQLVPAVAFLLWSGTDNMWG